MITFDPASYLYDLKPDGDELSDTSAYTAAAPTKVTAAPTLNYLYDHQMGV